MTIYTTIIDGQPQPKAYTTASAVCRAYPSLNRYAMDKSHERAGLHPDLLPNGSVIVVASHALIKIARPNHKGGIAKSKRLE